MKHIDGFHLGSIIESIDSGNISPGELRGLPIFDDASSIVCRGSGGEFVVLIGCEHVDGSSLNRVEGAVSTMGSRKYTVSVDGHIVTGYFCSLSLSGRQPNLIGVFCSVVAGLISTLSDVPSQSEIEDILLDYVKLLSRQDHATREVIVGLWGELRVMAQSNHPSTIFRSWRSSERSLFDFATESIKLEVKTTESSTQVHSFSHRQLTVSRGQSMVVSLGIQASNIGDSLSDLIDVVLSGLVFSDRRELIARVGDTLGRSIEYMDDYRFVFREESGIRCVRSEHIPVLGVDDRHPFSNIRYSVDLTDCLNEFGLTLTPELLDSLISS